MEEESKFAHGDRVMRKGWRETGLDAVGVVVRLCDPKHGAWVLWDGDWPEVGETWYADDELVHDYGLLDRDSLKRSFVPGALTDTNPKEQTHREFCAECSVLREMWLDRAEHHHKVTEDYLVLSDAVEGLGEYLEWDPDGDYGPIELAKRKFITLEHEARELRGRVVELEDEADARAVQRSVLRLRLTAAYSVLVLFIAIAVVLLAKFSLFVLS